MNEENAIFKIIQNHQIEIARNQQGLYKHLFIYDLTPLLLNYRLSEYNNGLFLQLLEIDKNNIDLITSLDKLSFAYITETFLFSSDGYNTLVNSVEDFLDNISTLMYEKYRYNIIKNDLLANEKIELITKYLDTFEYNLAKLTMFFLEPNDNVNNGEIDSLENLNGKFKLEDIVVNSLNGRLINAYVAVAYYFNYIEKKYE